VTSRAQLLLEVAHHVTRSSSVPYTRIVTVSARQLHPQAHRHTSSTPMADSYMDPNAIPDIAATMTHHGVLIVAEANAQLETLAPPSIDADAAMNKIMLSGRMSRS
jgi:hypothetical protein